MKYSSKEELDILRRRSDDNLELFAVYDNLSYPILKVTKLSKKFVYFEDGNKCHYPNYNSGYVLFDTFYDAIRSYKALYLRRKIKLETEYKAELEVLNKTSKYLNVFEENNPEFFV